MAAVLVQGTLQANGFFPAMNDTEFGGGYRVVNTVTERDAIFAERRKEGMVVYVNAERKAYRLSGGITNTNWVEVEAAGNFMTSEEVHKLIDDYIFLGNTTPDPAFTRLWFPKS